MRRLLPALLIALTVAPTLAYAQRSYVPHRSTIPDTNPRADNQPLRPSLPARPPVVATSVPTVALADPRGPSLGASRQSRRPASYVQDRTGGTCRMTCARERYACMASDDPDSCAAPWSRCVATCRR
jgi:hypothetical protein